MLYKKVKRDCLSLGRHITVEYYDCDSEKLLSREYMEDALLKSAKKSGAVIINSSFHNFQPQGVSGVVIIAESHFTVHTWPEHDYAAVDIFACGDRIDFKAALNSLKESFDSGNFVISSDQRRGIVSRSFDKTRLERELKDSDPCLHFDSWKSRSEEPWRILTSIDIRGCNPLIIKDAELIEKFVHELCDLIEMKRFGECRIVHSGEDKKIEGFSMTQLIENSLISGHFANASNSAYIDVFSCKPYEPREAARFAFSFFEGSNYRMHITLRK